MTEQSLEGWFLVAGRHLSDPNFFRSVVLMLQHASEGAMGLVVNRPSAVSIDGILSREGPIPCGHAPVYTGGPVEPTSLFILHNDVRLSGTDHEITPGLYLAGSESSFEHVVRSPPDPQLKNRFRLLSGYAGWGPGQLENELARGDWHTLPADGLVVLDDDPYGIWEICTRRVLKATRLLDPGTHNPEWN
jgi:putative transcriptional regulator